MPGIKLSPPASIASAASLPTSPIAAIRESLTATSARRGSRPYPSTTVAPRITRSYISVLLPRRAALVDMTDDPRRRGEP
jgi:hypothetical protein